LHGDPSIFASLPRAEKELAVQKEVQKAWIEFAHGEVSWGPEQVKKFGPDGNIGTLAKEAFLRDFRRASVWGALEAFSADEMNAVILVLIGHLVALVGKA